ncbi:DUF4012 domain-containing protein [Nocardioides sp. R-C-SC26]|uniref:DUF4012 domain-containing protein n=1 Tax=Nocardioides sp. R-C-SC26 TaxID=2870414 RepID=UPI001E3482E2|nr:DUF4012 domain-containing protein [Nocardioides sp. R-C-SC26]
MRRVLGAASVLIVAGALYSVWNGFQTARDLRAAQDAVLDVNRAIGDGDAAERNRALIRLEAAASDAKGRTDGPLWGALTILPFVGDDAAGVRALSASLDQVAAAGGDFAAAMDELEQMPVAGGVDIGAVRRSQEPVRRVSEAFARADDLIEAEPSDGFIGAFRTPYDDYAELIASLTRAFSAADSASRVLPDMLGAEGPRTYLLAAQNNAETRATGGLPGSWSQVRADRGQLRIVRQGAGTDFPALDDPVIPLSADETTVFGPELGRFFIDANFVPHVPRVAELMAAHWARAFPQEPLDGVVLMDSVSLSYILGAVGPVNVRGVPVTEDNVVPGLLNEVYKVVLDTDEQDEIFEEVVKATFDEITQGVQQPQKFLSALDRSVLERRLAIAPFVQSDIAELAELDVLGDWTTPRAGDRMYLTIDDATGSKMSFYLRYLVEAERSCTDGESTVAGVLRLRQTESSQQLANLPPYLTGGGAYGIDPGTEMVVARLYGTPGMSFADVAVDGEPLDVVVDELDGRPVVSLVLLVSGEDYLNVTFTARGDTTGIAVTPSILDGSRDVELAC